MLFYQSECKSIILIVFLRIAKVSLLKQKSWLAIFMLLWQNSTFAWYTLIGYFLVSFDLDYLNGGFFIVQNCWSVAIFSTKSHHISLNLTRSHWISSNLTESYQILSNLTISHKISPYFIKYHRISSCVLNLTEFHHSLANLTESHQISPYLTDSHHISPKLTVRVRLHMG